MLINEDNMVVTVHRPIHDAHADDMVTITETNDVMILYEADLYNAGFGFTMVTTHDRSTHDCPSSWLRLSLEASIAELANTAFMWAAEEWFNARAGHLQ